MDPFVAEIRIFSGNFAPKGWALCNGQLMSISQNTALFSLLGTNYGGDGKSTFGLPNLQDSAPMFWGQGPGLTDRFIGEASGAVTVTVTQAELPNHNHNILTSPDPGDINTPTNMVLARSTGAAVYNATLTNTAQLAPTALTVIGGSLPHNNMQPVLTLTFIIALQGVYPPRG
ncbi:MAG: phage tail protein [Saprospiraceae bacterium]|uniref:Phage tail protein n=1 Tax=Candidatus Opimibacter skivensis TaxID=2982028 RepID=A0A9D7SUU8_9BACT|nr:phage tail protein [Candidatus Opimibacter skivensis]